MPFCATLSVTVSLSPGCSVPRLKSGWQYGAEQPPTPWHSGSWQSMRPLPLSSMPLWQSSWLASANRLMVALTSPSVPGVVAFQMIA